MSIFEAPKQQSDGTYLVEFVEPYGLMPDVFIRWEKGAEFPTPDLRLQAAIAQFREKTIRDLTKNRSLFKTAPSFAALLAMTPVWGILLRGETMEWSRQDIWKKRPEPETLLVNLAAQAVVISRHSIVPIWGVHVRRVLPEIPVIDIDFGGDHRGEDVDSEEDDGLSVHSDDIAAEDGVVNLKNPDQRKRLMKAEVRELLQQSRALRDKASKAVDRFFSEFDLSEDESDFSDLDDEDD